MMTRIEWPLRWFFTVAVGAVSLCMLATAARADVSPAGCSADNTGSNVSKSVSVINNGDTVTYTVSFHNSADPTSCDVTDAVIIFTCPAADGTASGTVFALAGGTSTTPAVDCPAGSDANCFSASRDCTITVDPGVTVATAKGSVAGLLHDNPTTNDITSGEKSVSVNINTPTVTPTDTPTATPTDTPTGVPTDTPTPTPTGTPTATPTDTPTGVPTNTPTPTPTMEICRSAKWWAQHAGAARAVTANATRNADVTQKVIDDAGGCMVVCGEKITNTDLNDAESAVEGLCVPAEGASTKQLARYLIAAALNCVVNGGPPDCSSSSIAPVYAACNAACAAGKTTAMVGDYSVDCIKAGAYKLFHNYSYQSPAGGVVGFCADGSACTSGTGCGDLSTCASPPAGSIDKCNAAEANSCTVVRCKSASDGSCSTTVRESEGNCASGLMCASPETCSQTTCD